MAIRGGVRGKDKRIVRSWWSSAWMVDLGETYKRHFRIGFCRVKSRVYFCTHRKA